MGEIKILISAIDNPKHKLMVELMYSAGLRLSELVHLKPEHIEIEKNFGWVRQGKGNKDRLFMIAKCLKQKLKDYIGINCQTQNSWVFSGRKGRNISQR